MSFDTSSVPSARRVGRPSPRTTNKALPAPDAADEPRMAENAYAAISRALLEGRLRPGTPMRERQLAQVFKLTRGAVRKLLLRLAHEGKLQIFPNRGAFVPEPSAEDIRQVYAARKAVEAGMVALLAARITPSQIAALRAHVRKEGAAQREGRRLESVRLAGAFHLHLVETLANPELEAIVRRLVARTQLFVALFEAPRDSGCAPEEHGAIVAALATRDGGQAAASMLEHLTEVEDRVVKHAGGKEQPRVVDILRAALAEEALPAT